MKNRLNLQMLAAGIVIITGFLVFGCEMALNNGLQDPKELFAKKGAVVITNVSNSATVKSITVKRLDPVSERSTDTEITLTSDSAENEGKGVLIKAGDSLQVTLDPGTYEFNVSYGDGVNSPDPKKWTIAEYTYYPWYVTGEDKSDSQPTPEPSTTGTLQVINFSGEAITQVEIDSVSKNLPAEGIVDKGTISFVLEAGKYTVAVRVPVLAAANENFPDPIVAPGVEIKVDEVTNVMVFPDGTIEVGIIGSADANNLWILNRAASDITKVEKKPSSGGSYTDLLPKDKLPIKAGVGHIGTRLQFAEYDIKVTFGSEKPPYDTKIILNNDPVFLIVTDDGTDEIRGHDTDGDGFPDWWEDLYFGPDAKYDPNYPPRDGDYDSDGVDNWQEYLDGTDPTNHDTDGDGLWDGEEKTGTRNPGIQPEDRPSGEQIPDSFDPTDPLKVDTDGDGYSDYIELIKQSDPNDKNSKPTKIEIVVPWGE